MQEHKTVSSAHKRTKGQCMRRVSLGSLVAAFIAVLALVAAGCGSDSSSSSDKGSAAPGGAKVGEGKQGGAVTFLAAGDVDFLDPGQTYYTFGYMVAFAVNRTLYSFKPGDSTTPVPDLATGDPEISDDNKTITVHIRKGVKYAPPVNREVKAQDIKYGMERAFTSNVPSGYATSYFPEIEGAPSSPEPINKLK